jgi:glycosyltransferase involved in cell wall biosynthesis
VLHHDYPVTPSIWRLLSHERFDVLVVGGWSLFGTQAAILWARTHRVPYLLMAENHLREPRPTWVRALRRVVLPRIIRPAAGYLATGTLGREHALAYGARAETIHVFPNTIDVDDFAARVEAARVRRDENRAELRIARDAVAVLTVGRLIPFKAVDVLVNAVERAGDPLHLVVVGDGPERRALDARATRATFAGFLERDRLVEAYAAADVFALLSRRETWGVAVNEAMAASLPLVLSDRVGAAADLLVPGENGELVPVEDADAAARALSKLAADPALRARYGTRSRELVAAWGYEPGVEAFVRAVTAAR